MAKAYEYIVVVKDKASKALDDTRKAAGQADKGLRQITTGAGTLTSKLGGLKSMLPSLGAMLVATFSVRAISQLVGNIFNTRAEFEKYRAVLDNTFQSARMGEASMQMITEFASKTPFQVNELTGSFVKLVGSGLVPAMNDMTNIGDVASSQGKSFEQISEAILDIYNTERWREFGIDVAKSGDKMVGTFRGVKVEVDATRQGALDMINQFGEVKGVKGSMEVISKTTGGMLSNIQDKASMLMNSLGEKLQPLFEKVFVKLGLMIDWVNSKDFGPFIDSFIWGLGVAWDITSGLFNLVRNNLIVFKALGVFIGVIAAALSYYNLVASIAIIKTKLVTVASWLLNASLWANPITWVVIGIAALIAILITAYQKVGWFRGAIDAAWAAIKGFAIAIKDYVINRIKELLSGIVGIGKTLMAFFRGDWKEAWETGKKAVKDLVGVDSKKQFISDMKATGKDAGAAYHAGVAEVDSAKKTKKKQGTSFDFEAERAGYLAGAGKAGGVGTSGADAKKGASSITGGGSKQTNISISFGKLNESITIQSTTVKEGVGQVQQMLEEMLLRVINSANQTQTS